MTSAQGKIRGMMLCERPTYSKRDSVTSKINKPFYNVVNPLDTPNESKKPRFRLLTHDKRFLKRHQICLPQTQTVSQRVEPEEQGEEDQ